MVRLILISSSISQYTDANLAPPATVPIPVSNFTAPDNTFSTGQPKHPFYTSSQGMHQLKTV